MVHRARTFPKRWKRVDRMAEKNRAVSTVSRGETSFVRGDRFIAYPSPVIRATQLAHFH